MDAELERVWTGVAATIWRRPPGRVERVAARVLRSPALARALVTTPSLVPSWLVATALVYGIGIAVDRLIAVAVVALVAPAMAGAGIAFAYGPGTDPAYELTRTTPTSPRMVLLTRALAVFAFDTALALAASLVTPVPAGQALAAMAAVSALALAVATLARSAIVGTALASIVWSSTILGGQAATGRFDAVVTTGALTLPYLIAAAGCAVLALMITRIPNERGLA